MCFNSTPRQPRRHGRAGALNRVTPQPAGNLRGNEMRGIVTSPNFDSLLDADFTVAAIVANIFPYLDRVSFRKIPKVVAAVYLSIYLSKKSRLGRRQCRDTTRAPNNVPCY